jgi:hypothetical protein
VPPRPLLRGVDRLRGRLDPTSPSSEPPHTAAKGL